MAAAPRDLGVRSSRTRLTVAVMPSSSANLGRRAGGRRVAART